MQVEVFGADLELTPNGGAFWASQNAFLVADLHLGKGSSFRMLGQSPVPSGTTAASLEKLAEELERFRPDRLWILGDLWHRAEGCTEEVVVGFGRLLDQFEIQETLLIEGNHDRRTAVLDQRLGLIRRESTKVAGVTLVHEPQDADTPFFAGHIHPGVVLYGKGGQALKRPCFFHSSLGLIFPAFGDFTGSATVDISAEDTLFVLGEEQLHRLSGEALLQSYPRPFRRKRSKATPSAP